MSEPTRRTVFRSLAVGAGVMACTAVPAAAAPVPKKEPAKLPGGFTMQEGWRWCKKCEGLFLAGGEKNGTCTDGKEHDPSDSGKYVLQVAVDGGQGDWRRCTKCEGLFFGAEKRRGSCPAGKEHDPDEVVYTLSHTAG